VTSASEVVWRQIDSAGNRFLLAMELVDDDEFFAENKDGFSAAWVTGHLACVADLFSSWFDSGLLFEDSFHQVFNDTGVTVAGPVSKAASVRPDRFSKALLLHRFRQAVVKALRVLRAFDPAQWDAPAPAAVPVGLRTGGAVWESLGVHTDWHAGGLAGSMPVFFGRYALNPVPHGFYLEPEGS
jgi:hypothetical protein